MSTARNEQNGPKDIINQISIEYAKFKQLQAAYQKKNLIDEKSKLALLHKLDECINLHGLSVNDKAQDLYKNKALAQEKIDEISSIYVDKALCSYELLNIRIANLDSLDELEQEYKEFVTDNINKASEYSPNNKAIDKQLRDKISLEKLKTVFSDMLTNSENYLRKLKLNKLSEADANKLQLKPIKLGANHLEIAASLTYKNRSIDLAINTLVDKAKSLKDSAVLLHVIDDEKNPFYGHCLATLAAMNPVNYALKMIIDKIRTFDSESKEEKILEKFCNVVITYGPSVDSTPLMFAAYQGRVDNVKLLLENGALLSPILSDKRSKGKDKINREKWNALDFAIEGYFSHSEPTLQQNYETIIKLLACEYLKTEKFDDFVENTMKKHTTLHSSEKYTIINLVTIPLSQNNGLHNKQKSNTSKKRKHGQVDAKNVNRPTISKEPDKSFNGDTDLPSPKVDQALFSVSASSPAFFSKPSTLNLRQLRYFNKLVSALTCILDLLNNGLPILKQQLLASNQLECLNVIGVLEEIKNDVSPVIVEANKEIGFEQTVKNVDLEVKVENPILKNSSTLGLHHRKQFIKLLSELTNARDIVDNGLADFKKYLAEKHTNECLSIIKVFEETADEIKILIKDSNQKLNIPIDKSSGVAFVLSC